MKSEFESDSSLLADLESSENSGRRSFLQKLGGAGLGAAALIASMQSAEGAFMLKPIPPFPGNGNPRLFAGPRRDAAILNFALNLEYLEAEYYLHATTGAGLDATDIGTTGYGNHGDVLVKSTTTKVTFDTPAIEDYANEIAQDEANHVGFIRAALGLTRHEAVARPTIDLVNSFNALGGLLGIGDFDPFADELSFLLGAFIFEDVGVTAYKGASPLVSNKTYLEAAAGILGVEAYHAGSIRTLLYQRGAGVQSTVNAISAIRASLDGLAAGATPLDQGILVNGHANLVPADSNSVAFSRSTRQVLNIVYGGVNATSGLFFPDGLNGEIR